MARTTPLARRWGCVHLRNPEHASLGSCSRCSTGAGKPTRKRCACCGGHLIIEQGLWTVRRWDEAKRGQGYYAMEIVREFRSEGAARRYVDSFPGTDVDLIWHWVRHGETTIHGEES